MTQGIVDSLYRTRPAIELRAETMLPGIEEVRIRSLPVRVNEATTPPFGDFLPKVPQVMPFSTANHPGDDLPHVARNRCPEPQIALLADT